MPDNEKVKAKNPELESLVLDEMFEHLVIADPRFEERCQGQHSIGISCLKNLGSVLWNSTSRYFLGYEGIMCFGYDFSKEDELRENYLKRIGGDPEVIKKGERGNLGFYILEAPGTLPAA